MDTYTLAEEALGYVTVEDDTNTDPRHLVSPSKNVLIDVQKKVRSRPGYTRKGAPNSALTPIRNAFTWNTSRGDDLPIRFYDDEWEVYLGTIDATAINAWTRFHSGGSTTAIPRSASWFDTGENIDLLITVQGDDNLYEWNGAIAVVASITGTTITKTGTTTFAQNRFYTTRNKTVVCVRTGTEYTYTGGEGTTTLTGISDTTGLVAGDILVQKVVTTSDKPAANRNNHTIACFENQLYLGSEDDEEVWVSKNNDYDDFTYSAPRVAGEGGLGTLTDPVRGFGQVGGTQIIFCGPSAAFKAIYTQITVGTTLSEALTFQPIKSIGANQGALNQESIVPVGNALAYLSNEVALRILDDAHVGGELQLRTLSNPVKPDFDAETWDNACGIWHKNALWLSAPTNSHVYILEYVEDANGKLKRFWQPPQVLPVRAFSVIQQDLHGHSNAMPETYVLLDGLSDTGYDADADADVKLPIETKAAFAYRTYGKRAQLKTFDEYFVEGEINPGTDDLLFTLNYDYGGQTQMPERTLSGTDESILQGSVGYNSLAQQSLGGQSLSGLLSAPPEARKFNVTFEFAKEDFMKLQPIFSTNEVDRYWAITAHGPNVALSPRKNTAIRR